ncbi:EthD domain-containing protein [Novosphingobium sp. ERN07]|uniref:EthD domain-containing protein n=1 Tax=unclassified Novosphingobium TaxID=2644732 RepID=UPI0014572343|nr:MULTISPECIES: EthD domain-containing protein [unclassified Novosphingobium]NLR41609.1 EthD domain-containing protein [Novosphingobium sp. ERW19]NLR73299.1 EthD domain-containing protein [Novosphingobium sp. ERN07]
MTDLIQPKLIYLIRRHPAFTRADWTARWRQHAALGMSLPRWKNVARYVHGDVVEPRAGQHAYLADHDGVGLIWHRSLTHRAAHFADTSSQAVMVADEAETFADWIANHCLSAREEVLIAPSDAAVVKLMCFLWDDAAVARPDGTCGHVRNVPLPGDWGLDCTGIEEFWFADEDAANAAAKALGLTGRSLAVLVRDSELYSIGELL